MSKFYRVNRAGVTVPGRLLTADEVSAINNRPIINWKRATWEEIHLRYRDWQGGEDWAWLLGDFIPRVIHPGCSCRDEFMAWVKANPPDWTFDWTVRAHNAVNLKLGKPVMTLEEALLLWVG